MPRRSSLFCAIALAAVTAGADASPDTPSPATELDAFMAQVLARRDDNWRKLQQYVLDERERAELVGPGNVRLYGLARDYTWYIREGIFVRSPVRFDGVALGDADRQKYEREWIEREQARAARRDAERAATPAPLAPDATGATDADTIARLSREPQFVSMAYFLKFKFEPGHYAFAGRETYEGQRVYKIEYYPARLFADDDHDAQKTGEKPPKDDEDERIERQMNKVALVTLWIQPEQHQVLQYVFQNIGLDFLPGRWLVRVDDFGASMRMGEAFPGIWLPRGIDGQGRLTLASGTYTFRYRTDYENYREATVKARIR